jgi:hypothetical protein
MIHTRVKIFLFILVVVFSLFHLNNFFFWDNIVQLSVPANWYFDHGFSSLFLPDAIATGHPTFWGMYLAFCWKIFGRSLLISHLAMLPVLYGLLYQVVRFIKILVPCNIKYQWLILLALFADTSLMTQFSLLTFEVAHLFFFFLVINSFLERKNFLFVLAFAGLCLISLRSVMSAGGIVVFLFLMKTLKIRSFSWKQFLLAVPGVLLFVLFLTFFYMEKGWIIHNVVSEKWSNASEFANIKEMFGNTIVFLWMLTDFGRMGFFVIAFVALLLLLKRIIAQKGGQKRNLLVVIFRGMKTSFFEKEEIVIPSLIAISQVAVFFPVIVVYRNTFGPRYFLPVIIPVIAATTIWILKYSSHKRMLYLFGTVLLIIGHFIVYPPKFARGWPSTTAHWPYYKLRKEMIDYMQKNNIEINKTGSFFPNLASFKYIDLRGGDMAFKEVDWKHDEYIFYSNVFNVSDMAVDTLQNENFWVPVKKFTGRNIYVTLYKRRQQKTEQ